MLKSVIGLGLVFCLAAAAQDKSVAPSCKLVPGWTQSGAARTYDADNLFEYMDGNAEGYVIYGFQKMQGVTCQKDGVTFVVDISEMADADSSYGMFTANRDLRQPSYSVGAGGQIIPRRLIFVKGKYYLEIAANPEGDYTAALKDWAAAMEKTVEGNSTAPAALSWFSPEKQQSVRLIPESVLGLRILKRGYMAQYDYGKAFVVLEDTPASAGAVMQKLRERFAENTAAKVGDEAFQTTDKYLGRLCFFRKGRFIAGYAISAEGMDPVALSTQFAEKVQ
jgi:hypothetical protein